MIFNIDIDDTVLTSEKKVCPCCGRINYKNPMPIQKTIDMINKLCDNGHTIRIWTGRKEDYRELTVKQLKQFGVKYHLLEMGKPDGIYVDATNNYRSLKGFV